MRHRAIVMLLVLGGCHHRGSSKPSKPLGDLVGSWSSIYEDGRSDLDIRRDGTYAEARYDKDGNFLCTDTGAVRRNPNDWLFFETVYESDCFGREFYFIVEAHSADQFTYTRYPVEDAALPSEYVRQPGPLVSPELIASSRHHAAERLRRYEEAMAPRPDVEPEVPVDDRITNLMIWSQELHTRKTYANFSWDGYAPASPRSHGQGTDWAPHYATTAEWTQWPDVEQGYAYMFAIVVPVSAVDPRATLRLDFEDEVHEMTRHESDDGTMYVLSNAVSTREAAHEIEIHYVSGSSEPSILVTYAK